MFYVVSKIYAAFLSPIPLLLILALLGAILTRGRFARWGRALAVAATVALLVAALTPVGRVLIAPLEDRFAPPPADAPAPYGILILGGAIASDESEARGQPVFDEGERIVIGAMLARRYPEAKVVFSGGNGALIDDSGAPEARVAKSILAELGVDPARVTIEGRSRNTDENARFSAALLHPQPGQRWLLVTSGFHMPRSMGLFRKAGFDVVAYPVAFRTLGPGKPVNWSLDATWNLRTFAIAAKEWVGLAVYRATGRTDTLFPGPQDASPSVAHAP